MFAGSSQLPTTPERAVIKSIVVQSSDNETMLARKLGGPTEHLIDGNENLSVDL